MLNIINFNMPFMQLSKTRIKEVSFMKSVENGKVMLQNINNSTKYVEEVMRLTSEAPSIGGKGEHYQKHGDQ